MGQEAAGTVTTSDVVQGKGMPLAAGAGGTGRDPGRVAAQPGRQGGDAG
jgi:hypothetical protein